MNRTPFQPKAKGGERAYTMVELIAVVAIVMVIAGLVAPRAVSLLRGSQLTAGAQLINDQLHLAWQAALAKNRSVEVRFYQYAEPGAAGETDPASGKFRAVQLFEIQESGSAQALRKMVRLPETIIIDSGATLSSLIGSAKASPSVPTMGAGSSAIAIPGVNQAYNYVSFRFQPGGGTNLPPTAGAPWFITLHALADRDQLATPPANFITLQIDPINGHLQTMRP